MNMFKMFFLLTMFTCTLCQGLENPGDINIELLQQAWKIPTGGSQGMPYYSLEINGVHLQGERPWEVRWDLVKDILDYKEKKILELGCNVGLTSTCLLKYRGALASTGLDRTYETLAAFGTPRLMEASALVQEAFGVFVDIIQADINNSDYEEILGYDYDVVFCMSFLKWVDDKHRLLDYLANFSHVIFEGHDPDPVEIARFEQRGFQYIILGSTQIGASYPADATRTLIYFFK